MSSLSDDLIEPQNDRSFIRHAISDRVRSYPAMLGEEERVLPAFLAAQVADVPGACVELGCYLGGSTTAILEGLSTRADRPRGERPLVHAYDMFVANEFMATHSLHNFDVSAGQSFRPIYERLLGDSLSDVEIHEGNILNEEWPERLIKLLYVDILWSWEINQHVFDQFYRRLDCGSWLIHQDYVYSFYPWLPISMEWLVEQGYFEFRHYAQYSTVAFECLRSPDSVARSFSFESDLDFSEKRRLIKKATDRFCGYPKGLLQLSDCVLLLSSDGNKDRGKACVSDTERSFSHPWVIEHAQMVRRNHGIE